MKLGSLKHFQAGLGGVVGSLPQGKIGLGWQGCLREQAEG